MAEKRATYIQPSLLQDIRKIVEHYRRLGILGSGPRETQAINNQRQVYVRNDYAGTAPAYGCMQVTGTVEVDGQNYLTVSRPADSTGLAGWYVFNGPSEIEQDGFGIAFDGPLCRMLTDGSTVTAGDVWGPVASQWTIAPSGLLFVAAGEDDIAADVMKGFFKGGGGGEAVIGVTRTGGIAARTTTSVPHTFPSATIDLLNPDTGNFYSPNRTQVVFNSTSIAVGASRIVQAKRMKDSDRYFVDVDDC